MTPDSIPTDISLQDLHVRLRLEGCSACSLGAHPSLIGPVLSDGQAKLPVMLIGEAPGKDEDRTGLPFVGKAGKLLDEWLSWYEIDRQDIYISNVIRCRPIAVPGSGKQNNTPESGNFKACKPYLIHEINTLKPRLIITTGKSALKVCMTGDITGLGKSNASLKQFLGKFYISTCKNKCRIPPGTLFYPTYHPAALLHSRNEAMKQEMTNLVREHFKQIKEAINELR